MSYEDSDALDLEICSSSDEEFDKNFTNNMNTEVGSIRNKLAEWSINHQITYAAISDLLVIHKSSYDPSLPVDARTLLKTDVSNNKIILKEVPPGFYYHFGIESGIKIIITLWMIVMMLLN